MDYPKGISGTAMRLKDALDEANRTVRDLKKERRDLEDTIGDSDSQLAEFKQAYKATQGGSPWPVTVSGKEYSETPAQIPGAVPAQHQGRASRSNSPSRTSTSTWPKRARDQLFQKHEDVKTRMAQLETERQQKRIEDLAKEADQWFEENTEVTQPEIPVDTGPVRSLEDLIKAEKNSARPVVGQSAMNFLSGS